MSAIEPSQLLLVRSKPRSTIGCWVSMRITPDGIIIYGSDDDQTAVIDGIYAQFRTNSYDPIWYYAIAWDDGDPDELPTNVLSNRSWTKTGWRPDLYGIQQVFDCDTEPTLVQPPAWLHKMQRVLKKTEARLALEKWFPK